MTDGATDLNDNWIHLGLGASAEMNLLQELDGKEVRVTIGPANMRSILRVSGIRQMCPIRRRQFSLLLARVHGTGTGKFTPR
jgi:hypothetical protein